MNLAKKLTELEEIELLSLLEEEDSYQKSVLYKTVFNSFYGWQQGSLGLGIHDPGRYRRAGLFWRQRTEK